MSGVPPQRVRDGRVTTRLWERDGEGSLGRWDPPGAGSKRERGRRQVMRCGSGPTARREGREGRRSTLCVPEPVSATIGRQLMRAHTIMHTRILCVPLVLDGGSDAAEEADAERDHGCPDDARNVAPVAQAENVLLFMQGWLMSMLCAVKAADQANTNSFMSCRRCSYRGRKQDA